MKKILMMCVVMLFTLPMMACEQEGGAEKAGKELDKALDAASEKLKEATE